jgi:membrane fusion protein (multidrug efflux system)
MKNTALRIAASCVLSLLMSAAALAQTERPPMDPNVVRVLISPEQETVLVAPMGGRIVQLPISLGSKFNKGQTLVAFDCTENAARLKIAEAELKGARDAYDGKARLQGLQAAGELEVRLAAAAVDKSVGQVELSRAQLAYCRLTAPFSGTVAAVHVKQHQGVAVGAPLADIISNGPLKVRLNAPSRWLKSLKRGATFEVAVDETGRRYQAKVSAIGARVDPAAQTIEIEGRFVSTFPDLLPGMSGTAIFPGLQ